MSTAPRRAAESGRRGGVRWVTWLGVLVLVLGLAALGWSVYELFVKPAIDPAVTSAQVSELREAWAAGEASDPATAMPGDAVALLRIPALGDAEQPVLVGTDAALDRGLGWYAGTTAPGQVGNFAVAGDHGATGPFARLGELGVGDEVVVETATQVFTYQLTNNPAENTVADSDTWVLQPVPGEPEVRPTRALLTLTTSQGLFESAERTVAFGELVSAQDK